MRTTYGGPKRVALDATVKTRKAQWKWSKRMRRRRRAVIQMMANSACLILRGNSAPLLLASSIRPLLSSTRTCDLAKKAYLESKRIEPMVNMLVSDFGATLTKDRLGKQEVQIISLGAASQPVTEGRDVLAGHPDDRKVLDIIKGVENKRQKQLIRQVWIEIVENKAIERASLHNRLVEIGKEQGRKHTVDRKTQAKIIRMLSEGGVLKEIPLQIAVPGMRESMRHVYALKEVADNSKEITNIKQHLENTSLVRMADGVDKESDVHGKLSDKFTSHLKKRSENGWFHGIYQRAKWLHHYVLKCHGCGVENPVDTVSSLKRMPLVYFMAIIGVHSTIPEGVDIERECFGDLPDEVQEQLAPPAMLNTLAYAVQLLLMLGLFEQLERTAVYAKEIVDIRTECSGNLMIRRFHFRTSGEFDESEFVKCWKALEFIGITIAMKENQLESTKHLLRQRSCKPNAKEKLKEYEEKLKEYGFVMPEDGEGFLCVEGVRIEVFVLKNWGMSFARKSPPLDHSAASMEASRFYDADLAKFVRLALEKSIPVSVLCSIIIRERHQVRPKIKKRKRGKKSSRGSKRVRGSQAVAGGPTTMPDGVPRTTRRERKLWKRAESDLLLEKLAEYLKATLPEHRLLEFRMSPGLIASYVRKPPKNTDLHGTLSKHHDFDKKKAHRHLRTLMKRADSWNFVAQRLGVAETISDLAELPECGVSLREQYVVKEENGSPDSKQDEFCASFQDLGILSEENVYDRMILDLMLIAYSGDELLANAETMAKIFERFEIAPQKRVEERMQKCGIGKKAIATSAVTGKRHIHLKKTPFAFKKLCTYSHAVLDRSSELYTSSIPQFVGDDFGDQDVAALLTLAASPDDNHRLLKLIPQEVHETELNDLDDSLAEFKLPVTIEMLDNRPVPRRFTPEEDWDDLLVRPVTPNVVARDPAVSKAAKELKDAGCVGVPEHRFPDTKSSLLTQGYAVRVLQHYAAHLVHRDHYEKWIIQTRENGTVVARPWLLPSGRLDIELLESFRRAMVTEVLSSPGVTMDAVVSKMEVYGRQAIKDVVHHLAHFGVLALREGNVYDRCSLHSDAGITDSTKCLYAGPKAV
eukprot:TRINITY_DN2016_c0_g1_i1.p1 TRINITY_DN2016_c0_g1~~TRINITY_DN2016_c0_g1_i1.p1  ORF type:complete len:1093 (+),score=161.33 TRINITY_DN2016_c0_g1_i1:1201-4479(+)